MKKFAVSIVSTKSSARSRHHQDLRDICFVLFAGDPLGAPGEVTSNSSKFIRCREVQSFLKSLNQRKKPPCPWRRNHSLATLPQKRHVQRSGIQKTKKTLIRRAQFAQSLPKSAISRLLKLSCPVMDRRRVWIVCRMYLSACQGAQSCWPFAKVSSRASTCCFPSCWRIGFSIRSNKLQQAQLTTTEPPGTTLDHAGGRVFSVR